MPKCQEEEPCPGPKTPSRITSRPYDKGASVWPTREAPLHLSDEKPHIVAKYVPLRVLSAGRARRACAAIDCVCTSVPMQGGDQRACREEKGLGRAHACLALSPAPANHLISSSFGVSDPVWFMGRSGTISTRFAALTMGTWGPSSFSLPMMRTESGFHLLDSLLTGRPF